MSNITETTSHLSPIIKSRVKALPISSLKPIKKPKKQSLKTFCATVPAIVCWPKRAARLSVQIKHIALSSTRWTEPQTSFTAFRILRFRLRWNARLTVTLKSLLLALFIIPSRMKCSLLTRYFPRQPLRHRHPLSRSPRPC